MAESLVSKSENYLSLNHIQFASRKVIRGHYRDDYSFKYVEKINYKKQSTYSTIHQRCNLYYYHNIVYITHSKEAILLISLNCNTNFFNSPSIIIRQLVYPQKPACCKL